ncbi:MAG TPA: SRPBCC domain-containing protein [Ignavibacteria bacterium]|nr:SRPBCC domain-containing protein [Ignavibacteria bacterium]
MRKDLVVEESVDVNASVEKVWDALTNPAIIKDYLYGTDTITDWKPGSKITFQGEYEGKQYKDGGEILEFVPEKKLVYTYWSGFSGLENTPENHSIITYTVDKISDNKTRFTWTQKGFAGEEQYNHMKSGVKGFLQGVKKVMER